MRIAILFHLFLSVLFFACSETPSNQTANIENPPSETIQPAAETEIAPEETMPSVAGQTEISAAPIVEKTAAQQERKINQKPSLDNSQPSKTANPAKSETAVTPPPPIAIPEKKETQPVQNQPTTPSKPTPAPVEEKATAPQPPSHEPWDKLLQQYVTAAGKVNYEGFKKDKAKLDAYLETLQKNHPQNDWSKGEKMAFWINAYNAFTIKLITDNYPLTSITKLDGGKPWDVKRIKIGDKTYSLNNIENDILRPQFKDARIHFAVNCAAQSCPPLLNKAWTASNLESNFDKQAKAFVNNPQFNKITAKSVQVSKIFDWYSADFGNLIDYLNKYSTTKINKDAKVGYLEYDWGLNK